MNTPLGSISAHAEESLEILDHLRDGRLGREKLDDLRGRLMAIMRQANRCSRIATRLLQFAQPPRAMGAACRPQQVLTQVVELFSPTAHERGVHLDQQCEDNLPAAPVGPAELEQLLVNLVQNSLDACARGDCIRIEVRLGGTAGAACPTDHASIQLVVTDTGCGIPHSVLKQIFDPFYTTKPVGHGTGLGLSVCLGIARSVGGAIEVESAPRHGTRVTVTMPLEPPAHDGVEIQKACPAAARGQPADL
jgi:two-component system NtrC family sensor kinase